MKKNFIALVLFAFGTSFSWAAEPFTGTVVFENSLSEDIRVLIQEKRNDFTVSINPRLELETLAPNDTWEYVEEHPADRGNFIREIFILPSAGSGNRLISAEIQWEIIGSKAPRLEILRLRDENSSDAIGYKKSSISKLKKKIEVVPN